MDYGLIINDQDGLLLFSLPLRQVRDTEASDGSLLPKPAEAGPFREPFRPGESRCAASGAEVKPDFCGRFSCWRSYTCISVIYTYITNCFNTNPGSIGFRNMPIIHRQIEDEARFWALKFQALATAGPRQSGKTTFNKLLFPKKPYVILENPNIQLEGEADTEAFHRNFPQGAILDETQRLPILFR